ncbi:uncharacterized protein HMPREF1541_04033 [Cyphellophora europaea CBS 101466]|uniref:CENP-V/GFA domain-containing protein n=1 Tax=Cyphellophora europaea (strain CBS 101466) TaxID=1220924 RepID=W2S2A8_CYPE1|nr:uncharacterized protein HMPREF1541_04033 [Cyphellophora europaea CBS 101466]ETN42094.1 hypothetical protein HMPREF1541_04033 [Cyphellophora europaea CBS 101466]
MAESTTSKKSFKGSCHCGFITYTLAWDTASDGDPKVFRCNCTWCQKPGYNILKLENPEDFQLLTPASKDEMGDYAPRKAEVDGHRYFCKTCGTHIYREAKYTFNGQQHESFTVNALSIDQPQEGIDLSELSYSYCDGLTNKFTTGDKPFPGGAP